MNTPDIAPIVQRAFERPPVPAEESCGLCGVGISVKHGHVVNLVDRQILCVCRGCHLLFMSEGAGGGRFVAVPERCRAVRAEAVASVISEVLQVPAGLVFFFINSQQRQVVALYPSPSGATQSQLPLERWDAVVQAAPALGTLAPDVEALLVRSRYDGPLQSWQPRESRPSADHAYIVPIDRCYELVGRLRQSWQGFTGGSAWRDLETFFEDLARQVRGGVA